MNGSWVSWLVQQIRTTEIIKNVMCFNTISSIVVLCLTWKSHGVSGRSTHYHFWLDPKLGNGKCEIRWIPCACITCTNILVRPWFIFSELTRKPRYQHVEYCTYWPVLGSFKNGTLSKFPIKQQQNRTFMQCIKFY